MHTVHIIRYVFVLAEFVHNSNNPMAAMAATVPAKELDPAEVPLQVPYRLSSRTAVAEDVAMIAMHVLTGRPLRSLRSNDTLPGTLPRTLTGKQFRSSICREEYWVAEKSHGVRYVFVRCARGVFLVNRLLEVYAVAPLGEKTSSLIARNPQLALHRGIVVIDGELVRLPRGDPCAGEMRFIAFDVLRYEERSFLHEDFCTRYAALEYAAACFPQTIRKRFVGIRSVPWLLQHIEQRGDHYFYVERDENTGVVTRVVPNDGLVFVPGAGGYAAHIYKWKPGRLNTVDYEVHFSRKRAGSIELKVAVDGGARQTVCEINENTAAWSRFREGDIVECRYDTTESSWVPLCVRTDKTRPNFVTVYGATMEVLAENVTREALARWSQRAAV